MVKLILALALALGVPAAEAKVQWLPNRPPAALRAAVLAEAAFNSALATPFQLASAPRFPPVEHDTPQPSASPGSGSLIQGRRASQSHWLDRRADPPETERTLGPAFDPDNCIFCRDDDGIDDDGDAEAILRYMTSDMFMSYIKGSVDVLKDHCVFYTKGLNGLGGLSGPATSFACQRPNRLYTIWVRSPFSPLSDPVPVPEGR
jgi:hypothetical protein